MSDPLIGCDPAAAVAVRAISACLLYREWEAAEASGADRPTMGPDRVQNADLLGDWHRDRGLMALRVSEAMPPYPAELMARAGVFLSVPTAPLWHEFLALCADYTASRAMPPVPSAAVCANCFDPAGEKRCGWCGVALCDPCAASGSHLGGPFCCGRDECELARGRGAWVHCDCLKHHGWRAHCIVGMGDTADVEEAMERR